MNVTPDQSYLDTLTSLDVLNQTLMDNHYIDEKGHLDLSHATDEDFLTLFFQMVFEDRDKALSHHSMRAYRSDFKTLIQFMELKNLSFQTFTFMDVKRYNAYVREKYANRSSIRKLDFLKRLLVFGYESQFHKANLAPWIRKPTAVKGHYSKQQEETGNRPEIRELSKGDAEAIIASLPSLVVTKRAERTWLKKRNELIGHLLLLTGMRASEIISLNWGSFRVTNQEEVYADVIGKGEKHRVVPIREETVRVLHAYREALGKPSAYNGSDTTPLLLAMNHKEETRLSYDALYRLIKKAAAALQNQNPRVSPHWFRHTFITVMLEHDVPLAVVKDLAGHSDISTTNLYLERIGQEKLHEHTARVPFRT